jgi:hypothetical protein
VVSFIHFPTILSYKILVKDTALLGEILLMCQFVQALHEVSRDWTGHRLSHDTRQFSRSISSWALFTRSSVRPIHSAFLRASRHAVYNEDLLLPSVVMQWILGYTFRALATKCCESAPVIFTMSICPVSCNNWRIGEDKHDILYWEVLLKLFFVTFQILVEIKRF